MASGSFDLFHEGHRVFLQECKKHCDFLVVSVSSDEAIKKYKANGSALKPIRSESHRANLINDLKYVDCVIVTENCDKGREHLINNIVKPDIYFLGEDQNIQRDQLKMPAHCKLHQHTIRIDSTTDTIKKILSGKQEDNFYFSGANWASDFDWHR